MNNLVAFGCSYTYGHGLDDCFSPPDQAGSNPSNQAWPSILATDLGYHCVNCSRPGASNLEILLNLLQYSFKPSDTVIILWTVSERDAILSSNGQIKPVGAWMKHTLVKHWLEVHDQHDLGLRSWIYIHHAYQHLSNQKLNFKFLTVEPDHSVFFNVQPAWTTDINFLPIKLTGFVEQHGTALDQRHPSAACHRLFAKDIYPYVCY